MAVSISDRMYYTTSAIIVDKEEHYVIIKGPVHQKDVTKSICIKQQVYLKQKLINLKREKIGHNSKKVEQIRRPWISSFQRRRKKRREGRRKRRVSGTSIWNFRTFMIIVFKNLQFPDRVEKRAQIKDQVSIKFIQGILETKGRGLVASKLWKKSF